MGQVEPVDNLRGALAGAGLGAVLLELLRRFFDAWQKRDQRISDQRQQASKAQKDANEDLRRYLERRADDLEAQMRRLREEAADRERRLQESERREAQLRSAFTGFISVIATLLPDMQERTQQRVQNALDRVRQVSGLD